MKGKEAITGAERVRNYRAERVASGGKQVNIWLTPEALLALDETKSRLAEAGHKKSQSDIVCDALLQR